MGSQCESFNPKNSALIQGQVTFLLEKLKLEVDKCPHLIGENPLHSHEDKWPFDIGKNPFH